MATEKRIRVSSGTVYEERVGYSRAVRVGDVIHVSGTTATTRDGGFVGEGDPYSQTHQIVSNIGWALDRAGSSLEEVVRLRIYVVRFEDWPEVARALGEVFSRIRPTNTLVGTPWLVDPKMLVEIEVEAVAGSAAPLN